MRKPLITLLAAAALALPAFAASSAISPAPAHAAGCSAWAMSSNNVFRQSNNWFTHLYLDYGRWIAYTQTHGMYYYGTVEWRSFTQPLVKFRVTWRNGAVGVYEGHIDSWGYMHGTTYDERNPASRASWDSVYPATCVR